MSVLKIYKASAGSGKTFRLTGDYIDLLFENPYNYKNILAVTFTNKASAEMKARIIEQLYKMTKGEPTGYSSSLKIKYNLDDTALIRKSVECLHLILHDYSKFSIETIDSFFQKIILAFIREIGLQIGYTVELDTNSILEEVTEKMLYEIDKDEQLKKWLISYAESKIDEGASWNFKQDIILLGKELFKESFKLSRNAIIEKTSDKTFLKNYISELIKQNKLISHDLCEIGKKALQLMVENDLSSSDFFQGERGVGGFFEKLAKEEIPENLNSYVLNCLNDIEAFGSKASPKREIISATADKGLLKLLNEAYKIYNEKMPIYHTVDHVISFLPVLGIITDLSTRISQYTSENNTFLISDAAEFLYQITGKNDSPFIYEKTGNYYKYYMIDEFQDTSRLQWHNFKPLILNSLSENHDTLLVGDVKQSIYRWRNSDWKILAEEVNKEFLEFPVKEILLDTNWRSGGNIIRFNNNLFTSLVEIIQQYYNGQINNPDGTETQRIRNVYHQLEQKISDKKDSDEGYVEIKFIDNEEFREEAKKLLIEKLIELKDMGYQLRDISILVRNRRDGKEIADYLIAYNSRKDVNYHFEVISNDSLFISNNSAIKLLIFTLKYTLLPDDKLNLFSLVAEYLEYTGLKKEQVPFHFLAQKTDSKVLLSYLPGDFVATINKIRNLSVYGAVEYLTNFYKLYQNADYHPYLQAFKDLVHDFNLNKTSHFTSFIDWWDSTGITKTITINEQQDAIKIITIHKSKGLQYKAVLLPFCNWNLDHEPNLTNIMWCHPGREPFDQIEKLPVRYSSKLVNTIFKDEYDEEKLNAYVDNINLLYVAFTRSIKVLIAFCVKKESGEKNREKLNGISDFIYNALNSEGVSGKAGSWIKDEMRYVYGKINQQNTTLKISSNPDSIYTSVPLFERFEFSKQSGDYFNVSSALENKVEYGKLMHRVFQMIYTEKDIPKSIDLLVSEGKINKEESGMLQSKILTVLNKYNENGWFKEKYKIRNEPEIIMEDGKTCRPDRVMEDNDKIIVIDYKFGELEEEKHRRQVRSYMESIKKIDDNKKTEGFVWYVDLDILKKIE